MSGGVGYSLSLSVCADLPGNLLVNWVAHFSGDRVAFLSRDRVAHFAGDWVAHLPRHRVALFSGYRHLDGGASSLSNSSGGGDTALFYIRDTDLVRNTHLTGHLAGGLHLARDALSLCVILADRASAGMTMTSITSTNQSWISLRISLWLSISFAFSLVVSSMSNRSISSSKTNSSMTNSSKTNSTKSSGSISYSGNSNRMSHNIGGSVDGSMSFGAMLGHNILAVLYCGGVHNSIVFCVASLLCVAKWEVVSCAVCIWYLNCHRVALLLGYIVSDSSTRLLSDGVTSLLGDGVAPLLWDSCTSLFCDGVAGLLRDSVTGLAGDGVILSVALGVLVDWAYCYTSVTVDTVTNESRISLCFSITLYKAAIANTYHQK